MLFTVAFGGYPVAVITQVKAGTPLVSMKVPEIVRDRIKKLAKAKKMTMTAYLDQHFFKD